MKKILILALFSVISQCQSQKSSKIMIPTIDKNFETITKKIDNSRIDEVTGVNHIVYTSAKIGFGEVRYNKDSYFSIIKNFYSSKNIQNKGVSFIDGAPIGVWYYFNSSGELIKEDDTDKGYDFTVRDLIMFCKRNNISLPKGFQESGYKTKIIKQEQNGIKTWVIKHQVAGDLIEEIILNGKDGRELSKKSIPFINS